MFVNDTYFDILNIFVYEFLNLSDKNVNKKIGFFIVSVHPLH